MYTIDLLVDVWTKTTLNVFEITVAGRDEQYSLLNRFNWCKTANQQQSNAIGRRKKFAAKK